MMLIDTVYLQLSNPKEYSQGLLPELYAILSSCVLFIVDKSIEAQIDVVSFEKPSVCLDKLNTRKDNTRQVQLGKERER